MKQHVRYLPLKVLLGVAACLLGLAVVQKAWAETIPGKTPTRAQAAAAVPDNPWTGCGLGGHAGFLVGAVDFGAPVHIGSSGPAFGVDASCDYQNGSAVIGIAVNYTWLHGDLKTVGINAEYGASARAGYLLWPSTLAYLRAGWSRVDTDGGDVDGYKIGLGIEVKLKDAPIFVALEGQRSFYADVMGSGPDADGYSLMGRTTYKFNWAR